MKRMTTDNPQLNIERLLNTARAENNQAVLHLGDEVITLAEYVTKCAKEYGCNVTQESVMDGDNCAECDCPIAVLNILGIQAAENNARLKMIEKTLGNDYDLNRLEQLLEACKGLEPNEIDESKLLIATQKDTGKMARLRELAEADREGRIAILSEPMKPMIYKPNDTDVYCPTCGETLSGGWPLVEWEDSRTMYQCPYCGQSIDTQVCEPYESALKAVKERENDG